MTVAIFPGMQAAGRAWKLATGNLVAELGSVEA